MKAIRSKLILAISAIILFFLFTSALNKQEINDDKYVTMRVTEGGRGWASIIIVYPDGQSDEIELNVHHIDNVKPNTLKINQTINSISKKGYELVSSTGYGATTFYTFVKK